MIGFEFAKQQTSIIVGPKNKSELGFMYTQLMKDIILKMTDTGIDDVLAYCRAFYEESNNI